MCGGLDKQNPCKEPVLGISLRVCCNGEGGGACNIHNNRQETIKEPFHLGVYGGESDSQHWIHNHLFLDLGCIGGGGRTSDRKTCVPYKGILGVEKQVR